MIYFLFIIACWLIIFLLAEINRFSIWKEKLNTHVCTMNLCIQNGTTQKISFTHNRFMPSWKISFGTLSDPSRNGIFHTFCRTETSTPKNIIQSTKEVEFWRGHRRWDTVRWVTAGTNHDAVWWHVDFSQVSFSDDCRSFFKDTIVVWFTRMVFQKYKDVHHLLLSCIQENPAEWLLCHPLNKNHHLWLETSDFSGLGDLLCHSNDCHLAQSRIGISKSHLQSQNFVHWFQTWTAVLITLPSFWLSKQLITDETPICNTFFVA